MSALTQDLLLRSAVGLVLTAIVLAVQNALV